MLYVFLDIGGVLNRKDGFYDEDDFSFFCMRQFGNAIKDFPNVCKNIIWIAPKGSFIGRRNYLAFGRRIS